MCFSRWNSAGAKRSREIDTLISRDEKARRRVVKLLLLGAGESGKSTILKQMRLIYTKEGFSKNEKEEWRIIIFNNIVDGLRLVIDAMEEDSMKFDSPSTMAHVPIIKEEKDLLPYEAIPIGYLPAFKALWNDSGLQRALENGKFALHDNLRYFFTDLDRLFNKEFIPTDQDVLRARLRTTGITETIFDLGSLQYRMFDVGGQRSERKKWIHCFENVNALIFLVAISGYDQCLAEDKESNQMQEALMLWESIANSHWFKKSSLILFLNKMDLFKAKVAKSPITKYGFTDFRGNTRDPQQTSKYFMKKFVGLNRAPGREVYPHFTEATHTDLLKVTMASVQDMIIQKNLQRLIL
ncbi:BgTH12-03620 [Blumeria graminis f. sp. triticale]|uniref:Guanine nucleotide-binding protein alpha-2 subunit n=3 Tax=Blumeria graminis TaxID=34373 RepID=A0A061HL26_BLUGR|nr:Nucleotide binding alpha subunit of the heterotrimeric G protein [Blumeria graminis f. sp. tritici 96224]CAD6499508.1 BgTH12-03620 [Blumeria graminis f. sp. triticale]VCU39674.1 Bgt-2782 [Blumeria graminis f. sp. tritici]